MYPTLSPPQSSYQLALSVHIYIYRRFRGSWNCEFAPNREIVSFRSSVRASGRGEAGRVRECECLLNAGAANAKLSSFSSSVPRMLFS